MKMQQERISQKAKLHRVNLDFSSLTNPEEPLRNDMIGSLYVNHDESTAIFRADWYEDKKIAYFEVLNYSQLKKEQPAIIKQLIQNGHYIMSGEKNNYLP